MAFLAAFRQRLVRSSRCAAWLGLLLFCVRTLPADETAANGPLEPIAMDQPMRWFASDASDAAAFFKISTPAPAPLLAVDYRVRSLSNSRTSYEFGMPEFYEETWSPLSRLDFSLDSVWHGVQLGVQGDDRAVHVEYMSPMNNNIQGGLEDYDWMIPDASYTDLGVTDARWMHGHMLDIGGEFRLFERLFQTPVDLWPMCGFRYQQFNLMCYDLTQYSMPNPDPYYYTGDVLSFNQRYYMYYIGGQLRSEVKLGPLPPVRVTFQGDWADTQARNCDYHLLREGDRYTFDRTHGDTWHLGLTAEAPVRRWLTFGIQFDYQQTETTGTHRLLNVPLDTDISWTNGVRVWSSQTWLTAFARVRW